MSTEAQIDAEWAALDAPVSGSGSGDSGAVRAPAEKRGAYLSDEELLGIAALPSGGYGGQARQDGDGHEDTASSKNSVAAVGSQERSRRDDVRDRADGMGAEMPEWMRVSAADPRHAAEAAQLWQEHQAFRATFSTPEEVRALKEMFPGGAAEAQTLRQTTAELRQSAQAIDQFDAAIFSGDLRAQSELVTELARTNPAAFRSLFAEAAKVLGNLGQFQASGTPADPTRRANREGWGTHGEGWGTPSESAKSGAPPNANVNSSVPRGGMQIQQGANGSPAGAPGPQFDAAAYASFERTTNDVVARDVRASVSETLSRVLPEGIAEGAARRIGEDIFNEIHRTMASDRTLSQQVGEVLRGWRFGAAEQQRVAALLAGRAKQLVPAVARRVIGEWTGSVLGTARNREARRSAAASRVDIAEAGGSLDSMPLRPMSAREIHYASMSDDDILGM